MGLVTLGGHQFRIDPSSISWSYRVKTKVTHTVGGKVVQVFGTKVDDLTLRGSIGVGGAEEQKRLSETITGLADAQANMRPHRLHIPQRGWDLQVYIKRFRTQGGEKGVVLRPGALPRWELVLFVAQGNAELTRMSTEAYIERLSEGIGWVISEYNGPADLAASLDDQEDLRSDEPEAEPPQSSGSSFWDSLTEWAEAE